MPKAIITICIAYGLATGLFVFRENGYLQLLCMYWLLGWLAAFSLSIRHVFRCWSQSGWRSALPLVACVFAFVVPVEVGAFARDSYFRSQIPHLREAIDAHQKSNAPSDLVWRGDKATISKVGETNMVVMFWWGVGFPVKHTALVYYPVEDHQNFFREGGWRGYALQENWWVVRD